MQSSKKTSENGSALLVTIMITSVVLIFAMILLERIIPYSRQIRGMQDSLQAYYTARSEVELAKNEFQKSTLRENIDSDPKRIPISSGRTIDIAMPNMDTTDTGDSIIISEHSELPLQIRMFPQDTSPRGFGTSQKNPNFHSLAEYGGGMLFDLTNKDTMSPPFSMIAHTDASNTSTVGNIQVEFVYTDGTGTVPFFGTVGDTAIASPLEGKNIATALDKNRLVDRDTLAYLFRTYDCGGGSCALKLHLKQIPTNPPQTAILPVSFSVSTSIPDLNAVLIADGLSEKATYHTRIIELIPLTQSI
jgi:hypothetical protein